MKRIAVIDLMLHYPPRGGACVDIVNTFTRLAVDYDIRFFGVDWNPDLPRCRFDSPPPLPCDVEQLPPNPTREKVIDSFLRRVGRWNPDLVFFADGWTLKPYLINAFKSLYPVISRFYAYEGFCPRTNERWRYDEASAHIPCDNWALDDTPRCLACADAYRELIRSKKNGRINHFIDEAETAGIWRGDYAAALRESLDVQANIVYNSLLRKKINQSSAAPAIVVPGGVDPLQFTPSKPAPKAGGQPFTFLVFGRMDNPAKGAGVAIAAGKILAASGLSFKMVVTRERRGMPALAGGDRLDRQRPG